MDLLLEVQVHLHNGFSRHIIFMAWAEAPSIDLFGGGANAR